ncbi:hypothetical protein ACFVWG_39345 [Kribbella sp. NPDC058245]|uniref:hypothetical protein n=1 Tax=Kribbella sp. NPDC058245 TaxID=3346399 RepID=UPI0036EF946F
MVASALLLSMTIALIPSAARGVLPAAAQQITAVAHPRIALDTTSLASLRQRAQANDPAWTALKQKCEGYVLGTVEWPDGNADPGGNNIGSGYQGEDYFPAITNLGLCYRVAQTVDPARAPAYGAKGVEVLVHMSAPAGDPHAPDPLYDDGYGIRFYGVGMAIGFDWLYDALAPADRTRVYTAVDRWVDAYEAGGYGLDHPQGNYYAGYYATKAVAALATEGDDPRAPAQWTDFLDRVHGQVIQPYYAANLTGGGWPEGQNYGPLATFNMTLPVLAAKTAKGIDLVNAAAPYKFPSGMASWYMYNVWPSLQRVDDRGTMRVLGEPAPASVKLVTQLAGMLPTWSDPLAPAFHRFARDVRAANPGATPAAALWSDFLFWDPAAPEADYKTSPLASFAPGMEMGSVRSSWETGAVWGSLNAGPYTGNPDNSEQLFDAGSLAVARGNRPFLVNATGQLFRGSVKPDDFVYNDNFGSSSTRGLYNVFLTDTPTPTGQTTQTRADGSRTKMGAFDQTADYAFMRASQLEDMYPRGSAAKTISSWSRDVVYLRPNLFVVYDRTTTTSPSVGQTMRFHFAGTPARVADPSTGVSRYDIGSGTTYAGSVSSLLPAGHTEQVTPTIFGGSDVSRIDVKPGPAAADNRWLTVVDAAAAPGDAAQATRLSVADGNVLAGAVTGTFLQSSGGNYAVLNGTAAAGTTVSTPIRYHLPAGNTRSIVTDLAPNTTYAVTTTADATGVIVEITAGSGPRTSAAGVLSFTGGPPAGDTCQTSPGGGAFVAKAFPAQSGSFAASWNVTPGTAAVDGAVGLSKGSATKWSDLAAIVRFGPDGTVDARNGSTYPVSSVHYQAGIAYKVRVQVDVAAHTYSAWLQPPGGAEVVVAQGYQFRTEQQAVTSLDNSMVVSDGGQLQACTFTVS